MGNIIKNWAEGDLKINPVNAQIYSHSGSQDRDLTDSIKENGVLEPLLVTPDGLVLSGNRRLACARAAGLEVLPCRTKKEDDPDEQIIRLIEHNRYRVKTPTEIYKEASLLEQVLEAKGRKTKALADKVGVNNRKLERIKYVMDSGDETIIQKMDSGELTVSGAYNEAKVLKELPEEAAPKVQEKLKNKKAFSVAEAAKQVKQEENAALVKDAIEIEEATPAYFSTIVAQPNWDFSDIGQVNQGPVDWYSPSWPVLSLEELAGLQVKGENSREIYIPDLAKEDAHVYIFCPGKMIEHGIELCRSWGFEFVTVLTMCKSKLGHGRYYRENTISCVFGVRGDLECSFKGHGTHIKGEEPADLLDVIEEASPGPILNLFIDDDRKTITHLKKEG